MKIIMNNRMKKNYRELSKKSVTENMKEIDLNLYCFNDVIIINKGKCIDSNDINNGINMLGGKMEYEISKNEIYINNYIIGSLNNMNLVDAGLKIIDYIERKVKKLDIAKNICYILSIDDEMNGTLFFHEIINNKFWIDKDLEKYSNYVLVGIPNSIKW